VPRLDHELFQKFHPALTVNLVMLIQMNVTVQESAVLIESVMAQLEVVITSTMQAQGRVSRHDVRARWCV
jgi:hypothetical protein